MPSWFEIVDDVEKGKIALKKCLQDHLAKISTKRDGRNVILYASSFLQKPYLPPMTIQITNEDLNGFMAVVKDLDFTKGLVLILHTPGGITSATEPIVDYLHDKFPYIETIVPTFAMSAGTMIALSTDKIIMGRSSQLGPIDPQMAISSKTVAVRSIIEQFEKAKKEIHKNQINAHVWAPILASMSDGILIEAEKANKYSEELVKNWLKRKNNPKAEEIAQYFNNPSVHNSHGKRIDRKAAAEVGVITEELEKDQELQDAVLTVYHIATILFEKSRASKIIGNNKGNFWVKNAIDQN